MTIDSKPIQLSLLDYNPNRVLIPLTQGQFTIIDAIDAKWVLEHKWYARRDVTDKFHAQRTAYGERVYFVHLHREIMACIIGRKLEIYELVDHIDRDSLNNTRDNLRIADHVINGRNHGGHKHNTSGFNGVSWHNSRQLWRARITVNKRTVNLGWYKDFDDAVAARLEGEKRYWGERR